MPCEPSARCRLVHKGGSAYNIQSGAPSIICCMLVGNEQPLLCLYLALCCFRRGRRSASTHTSDDIYHLSLVVAIAILSLLRQVRHPTRIPWGVARHRATTAICTQKECSAWLGVKFNLFYIFARLSCNEGVDVDVESNENRRNCT